MSQLNNPEIRPLLRDVAARQGVRWAEYGNVKPADDTFSTIFMTAQRPELRWVYGNQNPPRDPNEMGTGWCVRSDSMAREPTTRHLTAFEMLGITGIMPVDVAVRQTVEMICQTSGVTIDRILATAGEENREALQTLRDLGISTRIEDLIFERRQHTDKTGFRVELGVGIKSDVIWEVQNLVIIDHDGVGKLGTPMVDSGGSLERIATIKEGGADVYGCSLVGPIVKAIKNIAGEKCNEANAKKLADLARAGVIMSRSEFVAGKKGKQEQTFRSWVRRYVLRAMEMDLSLEVAMGILEFADSFMESWGAYGELFAENSRHWEKSGVVEMAGRTYEAMNGIMIEMKRKMDEGGKFETVIPAMAKKYDGGTEDGLVKIAVKRLGFV